MVSMAPMVTTPVPPTPAIKILYGLPGSSAGRFGSGNAASNSRGAASSRFGCPPMTLTKLGQNPSTQE